MLERKTRILKQRKNDNEFNQNKSISKNENRILNELKNFDWLTELIYVAELSSLK